MNTLKRMTSLLTLGSFLVAQWPAVALADTSVRYLYNDARGTPVAAADEQGNLLWRKHYRPFGAEVELTGDEAEAVADDRGFTGHTYDRESGLVYMGRAVLQPAAWRVLRHGSRAGRSDRADNVQPVHLREPESVPLRRPSWRGRCIHGSSYRSLDWYRDVLAVRC